MPRQLRDRLGLPRAAPKPTTPPRAPAAPPDAAAAPARPTAGDGPTKGAKGPSGPTVTLACGHTRPLEQLARQRCQACTDADKRAANDERRKKIAVARSQRFRLPHG